MKVSNTDIIDTVTDEKKLNWCLIQGQCFKKSLSILPKSENYAIERCRRLATQHSLFSNFVELYRKVLRIFRATFQIQTVQTDFLFENLSILKVLNVLGLKNSTDFKESKQYYTILPIFEHFGCQVEPVIRMSPDKLTVVQTFPKLE